MDTIDRKEIVDNVLYLIDAKDEPALKNLVIDFHPADLAEILQDLEDEERAYLFSLMTAETASEVMTELDEVTREDIVSDLETARLSEIVDEMDSDDAADVVAELPQDIQVEVLAHIEPQDRAEVEKLLVHEEDSAGGIMALEYIAVYDDQTVQDAVREIRRRADEIDEVFYIYAIDRSGRLVGVVPLKSLFLRNPQQIIRDIMYKEVISVSTEMDQEQVAKIVRKYNLSAVPVVDRNQRLIGRITIDDIIDVLHEEANEDIQRMAGISDEEVLQDTSTFRISRNRLPWLLISFFGELGSALVLNRFNATLEEILISAFFIPVIMATGGNSGIQSSTIVVRSLAMNEAGATGLWNRVYRELRVAILNGLIVGALLFAVIFFWKHNMEFGIVGGLAIILVMINSAAFGAIVPFALHKFKIDPAIATGPFITTANDIFGLLIYLGMTSVYLASGR
ncbi:magnesium transporter [candidate division KSB1 bacterium]|nr:magnesium transporter [candidate division KSB1 bacterium]RQW08951.1 MAG: magnesium transporter [candidate division KSB1 bacterium]